MGKIAVISAGNLTSAIIERLVSSGLGTLHAAIVSMQDNGFGE